MAEDVFGFPLLVRLGAGNFDFSQAAPDGRDVRFVSASGDTLNHQTEWWDAGLEEAAVWVLMDTVQGNSDTQYITMTWGNPDADDLSDGAAVFDTAAGFIGVYHICGVDLG